MIIADSTGSAQKNPILICGHFGSGKTEIAINLAIAKAQAGEKVTLVDLDVVNPYFRSREVGEELAAYGIQVISTQRDLQGADIPAISAEVLKAIKNPQGTVIVDVGGDEAGATALGQFRPYLKEGEYTFYFVLNPRRPFTRDREGAKEALGRVARGSRLRATQIISNPHLGRETTLAMVLEGHRVVEEMAEAIDLPIEMVAVRKDLADEIVGISAKILPLTIFMRLPWEKS